MGRWLLVVALVGVARCRPVLDPEPPVSPARKAGPQTSVRRPWAEPVVPTAAETPLLTVDVRLLDRGDWSPLGESMFEWPFYTIPGPEADWPDLDSVYRLRDIVDRNGDEEEAAEAFLDAAEREGLLDGDPSELDDPWDGLLAQWAAFIEMMQDWPPDASEIQWLAERTQAVIRAHPDSEPADALRYGLALMVSLDDVDVGEDWRDILIDLTYAPDDVLARAAIGPLLSADGMTAGRYERMATPTADADRAVARAALQLAVREGTWAEVDRWVRRLEETENLTESDLATVDEVRGMMALAGVAHADDWRSELIAAVYRCHAWSPVTGERKLTWAVADQTWTYTGALDHPLELCLERWTPATTSPAHATIQLQVSVPATRK